MQLHIDPQGQITCIYSEEIDLAQLGTLSIRRASQVDADEQGQWWADLALSGGPLLGPFGRRTQALAAEQAWLESH